MKTLRSLKPTLEETTVFLVAGKGGVGKSTLSCALALSAKNLGHKVALILLNPSPAANTLKAGLENNPAVAQTATNPIEILTLKPEEVLIDYLQDHGLSALGNRLISSGIVSVIATAIPGIKELLILAKIKQMERSGTYDTIILDSPASGHLVTFLSSPRGLAEIAKVGLLRTQADEVAALLGDAKRCQLILVTLAEETPVEETVQTIAKIKELSNISLGPVIVNGVVPQRTLSAATRSQIEQNASGSPEFAAFSYLGARREMQDQNLEALTHKLQEIPSFRLPFIFTDEITFAHEIALGDLLLDLSEENNS